MGEAEEQETRNEKTRRQFDDEFKKDAVRLFESGNPSLRQVAELDGGITVGIIKEGAHLPNRL